MYASNVTASGSLAMMTPGSRYTFCDQPPNRPSVAESVMRYAVQLARTSRPSGENPPDFIKQYVNYGASLRASQFLILGGKARALINGRYNVAVEDIQALAYPVFRHRILANFHAESEGIKTEEIIRRLIEVVPVPQSGLKE